MRPLLKKEIRLLLPAWCVAMVLAVVPPWFTTHPFAVAGTGWIPAFGALILAVTAFGREFALGTFSSVLAQPAPRERIFLVKGTVLAVALICVLAAFWFSYIARLEVVIDRPGWYWDPGTSLAEQKDALRLQRWSVLALGGVGAAVILAGGIWTTLVFRQMVAAFWITLLVPAVIVSLTTWLAERLKMQAPSDVNLAVLTLYSLLCLGWSWRLFLRAEDAPFTWGNRPLPSLGELLGMKQAQRGAGPRHPFAALIRQELSLHQTSLVAAAILLILSLIAMAVQAWGGLGPNSNLANLLEMRGFIWLLIPLFLGASAIAEERRHGTLVAYLCLPISRWKLFLFKFGVAAVFGILLGAGALLLTEVIGQRIGATGFSGRKGIGWEPVLWLPVVCVALTFVGYYASSLSRSTLHALGIAIIVVSLGLTITAESLIDHFIGYGSPLPPWILVVHWGALLLISALLGYRNFRRPECTFRLAMHNVMVIVLTLTLATTLAAGVYFRTWELVMPLEPDHGPARIAADGQPKIAAMRSGGYKLLVLLPDGRLWISGQYRIDRQSAFILPTPGAFLATSNWTDLAACGFQAIALHADGTLWSLRRGELTDKKWKLVEDQPRQIGNETNWVMIAAGQMHMLALKSDGTLWGWGSNKHHQVCERPEETLQNPIQIGQNSDWAAVFARHYATVGVKRDGSVWQWGNIREFRRERSDFKYVIRTQPQRWEVDLSDVRQLAGGYFAYDLLLHKDGRLSALGQLPFFVLGTPLQPRYTPEPVPVGGGRLWRDVAFPWHEVVGVSQDGRLWKDVLDVLPHRDGKTTVMSGHTDWLAVGTGVGDYLVALAADGTLTCWAGYDRGGALTSSRRPLTSFNIFDEAE